MFPKLKINELFRGYQCEGFNQGLEVIFVRFYGCNLSCFFCDTPNKGYTEYDLMNLIMVLQTMDCKNIIITGGEPTEDKLGFNALVKELKDRDYWVGLETNGTYDIDENILELIDYVSLSPKTPITRIKLKKVNEIRVVVSDIVPFSDIEEYEKIESDYYYLSFMEKDKEFPYWDRLFHIQNKLNKRDGGKRWQPSIQLHKIFKIK